MHCSIDRVLEDSVRGEWCARRGTHIGGHPGELVTHLVLLKL
jgi:hypothetical protein